MSSCSAAAAPDSRQPERGSRRRHGGGVREGADRRRDHRRLGRIAWIPAHQRSPDRDLTVDDALRYLRTQSLHSMDDALVETFVRTGAAMLDFVEKHSGVRFEIAAGFPDYRPELPGGQPAGGRSLGPAAFEPSRLGEWASRITSFPPDWSNVASTPKPGLGCTPASRNPKTCAWPVPLWWPGYYRDCWTSG